MEEPNSNNEPKLSEKGEIDLVLVNAALNHGDQKAYAELMGRYRDIVHFMILKMIGNKDDADDLTIEAFGKAFKNLNQYSGKFTFSTWLFRIATNNCIDFLRKKKMQTFSIDKPFETHDGDEIAFDIRSEGLNPEEDMVKKQKVQLMRDVVEKLKPRYKQLVELRYFEELSIEEIAVKMEMPTGTVKAHLFRAREFLATILNSMDEKM